MEKQTQMVIEKAKRWDFQMARRTDWPMVTLKLKDSGKDLHLVTLKAKPMAKPMEKLKPRGFGKEKRMD